MKSHFLSFAVAALLAAGSAGADTIDFTQLPDGDMGSGAVTVDGVTFKGEQNLYNYSAAAFVGEGGGICSLDPIDYNCQNDMTVKFNGKVKKLSLASAAYDTGDSVTISAYRGKKFVGSTTVSSDGAINLAGLGRITKLEFDDNSTGAGLAFGKFKFRRLSTTAKHDDSARHHRPASN
jgi:hypothetical protein